ncbi:hypothetical protein BJ138DRAFT_3313 [Hygrophoropsis aurantiaca]|uniref:Uncharacterized protein n=1 Tax=Hygrophoropsis aurantiaca TaxID=72124 RepID=A0ACB8AUQ6_9AGAM|nr:hypothetical protein BJ138DRAFT_3313 [Hygrophoropsis aurantiaca]
MRSSVGAALISLTLAGMVNARCSWPPIPSDSLYVVRLYRYPECNDGGQADGFHEFLGDQQFGCHNFNVTPALNDKVGSFVFNGQLEHVLRLDENISTHGRRLDVQSG